MSELSTEERLAALRSRRQPNTRPKPAPSATPTSVLWHDAEQPTQTFQSAPAVAPGEQPSGHRAVEHSFEWSWNRVAATGASVVSFASMIVAMGPILKSVESTATESADPASVNLSVAGAEVPAAPPVDIEVAPNPDGAVGVTADPSAQPSNETAAAEGETLTPEPAAGQPAEPASTAAAVAPAPQDNGEAAQTTPPDTAAPANTEASDTAPANPAPNAAAQATTAPPAPPATTPPATAAPITQPPVTAPPTTAPPTTQAPVETPPPRSDGSGG